MAFQMSMEEHLHALSIDKPSGTKDGTLQRQPPKADTLAMLLAQGLQSKDKTILNVSGISMAMLSITFSL